MMDVLWVEEETAKHCHPQTHQGGSCYCGTLAATYTCVYMHVHKTRLLPCRPFTSFSMLHANKKDLHKYTDSTYYSKDQVLEKDIW